MNVVPIRPLWASETLLGLEEARKTLQLRNASQLRRIIDSGELPTIRHKGREMIREADLDAFIRRQDPESG